MTALLDELKTGVNNILKMPWKIREASKVPDTDDVALTSGGAKFKGTVLYSDLAQSSQLVTEFQRRTAAKIIKCFLYCCSKLISYHNGKITSFDGDRIMGVFIGDSKNTDACTTALKIKYATTEIIKPKVEDYFRSMRESPFEINHAVGIDTSAILAVRAGQRGSNDLIWVGRSPNFSASLSEIRETHYNSYITKNVFSVINDSAKYGGKNRELMWEKRIYAWLGKNWTIYRSDWYWKP